MTRLSSGREMKYHSVRTWSELCGRFFASKAEARRGEELHLLQLADEIEDLRYQERFVLSKSPNEKVSITVDFIYLENGKRVLEDVKGIETREFRVKRIWLKQLTGIDIKLTK